MSDFRRLRRGNTPHNREWLRTILELIQPKEGYEPEINLEPKPFRGRRNKAKHVKLFERRLKQKKNA